MPYSPLRMLVLFIATSLFVFAVQVGLMNLTFQKLNLSAESAMLLLFTSLMGSGINLPLFSITADEQNQSPGLRFGSTLRTPLVPFQGRTMIAINVGGALVPLGFSLYLFLHSELSTLQVLLSVAAVAASSYRFSEPVAGIGIAMPVFIAPLLAALVAIFLAGTDSAPLAYISGTLGVLLGADLLHLQDVRHLGAPIAAIGGAGTFDGVYLTGLVAVILS